MEASTQRDQVGALLHQRIAAQPQPPSAAALKVIRYIERNPAQALSRSAADIAAEIGLSDATVIRAVQGLGFDGMADLRQAVASALDDTSPTARMRRTLGEVGDDIGRAIDAVLDAHQEALTALRSAEAKQSLSAALRLLHPAERIVVFGIGPSAMLARYVVTLLVRVGRLARTLDATGIALADQLLDLRPGDALLLLAYGRAYPEVTATITQARQMRLPMALVTDSLETSLARHVDVVVPAQRGRSEHVALHSATLVALEALVLGLAATDRPRALAALEQLNGLREAVTGTERFNL